MAFRAIWLRRLAGLCGCAVLLWSGVASAQGTVCELAVRERVLPTDGVPVAFGEGSGAVVSERAEKFRLVAELLIPRYPDFPDPALLAGGEAETEAPEGLTDESPVRWDSESMAIAGGSVGEADRKPGGTDLGGIGVLSPGEEMWALCFAVPTRVSANPTAAAPDMEVSAAGAMRDEFWQGGLDFSPVPEAGMLSLESPESEITAARFLTAAPVRASVSCALIALLGAGWLVHRIRRRMPEFSGALRPPGDEW